MDPSVTVNTSDLADLKPNIAEIISSAVAAGSVGGLRGGSRGLSPTSTAYSTQAGSNSYVSPGGGYGSGYIPPGGGSGGQFYGITTTQSLGGPTQTTLAAGGGGSGGYMGGGPAQSPAFNIGQGGPLGGGGQTASGGGQIAKHLCAICGDRASGKHYGVYSCEGCKGFFKRTVRKDLQYACRDDKNCVVDKRQRNRCQYCRYVKCLNMGMKREAVQEERQRAKERGSDDPESSSSSANSEMPVELILEAELATDPQLNPAQFEEATGDNPMPTICQSADRQLFHVVDWAKRIPHFTDLPIEDQVILLRAGWNELLIAGFSHRSTVINDGILLATGVRIHRTSAHSAGVGTIFDRILTELVAKMREMSMDKTELGCLKAVVLFNPDAKGLQSVQHVESLREKVYASLEEYCKLQYPDEPGRFAKLLLRLPALRSIGLKFIEHLFFFKLIGDTPLDSFLLEMLDNSATGS